VTATAQPEEIDPRTLKLIVGVIATTLPLLTWAFAGEGGLASISASYYEDSWSRTIFLGFLFAIASFLIAHNGLTTNELILSKVAAAAGLLVALYPCDVPLDANGQPVVPPDPDFVPYVHGLAAAVMFVVLAYFCLAFYRRAKAKHYPEAERRALIYVACGVTIVAAILALALDYFLDHRFSKGTAFIFWGEAVALVAFGVAWFTASKVTPGLASPNERFSPLRRDNPPVRSAPAAAA
jgi:hypothetical protein